LEQFASIDGVNGVLHSLLKNELHIFHCLQINPKGFENPLVWSVAHKNQFLHVFYLVHQIFGIVGSLIMTKRIFNIVEGIINPQQSKIWGGKFGLVDHD
jgi:hypothetical protein